MKIEDQNSSKISRLAQQQRNLVAAKEAEIENVRQLYDHKKENERLIGQEDLIEVRDLNQRDILQANAQKSERLQQAQHSLQKDLQRLESERAILSEQGHQAKKDALERLRETEEAANGDNLAYARDIGRKTNEAIAKLQQESQWQVADASAQASTNFQTQERLHENNLAQTLHQQRLQLTTKEIEHAQKLNQLEADFRRDSAKLTSLSSAQEKNRALAQEKSQNFQKTHYDNLLDSRRQVFEQKLQDQAKQYESIMARTKERFEKQLGQLSASYAKSREVVETKAQDPFYALERLPMQIEETPKSYLVHIPIAQHEAENVLASARDRTIKLTMSRRYSERIDGDNGHVDINKRSESFSHEMPVQEIVSSKGITRKYQDGILTFLINKA